METSLSDAFAEHLLGLFAPGLDGARSALETCCATQTIIRDWVAELEQERSPKQIAAIPPEESRLVNCGPDLLLLVCSFLKIKEKVQFRVSSLGLHSMLLGCAINLTESNEIRKLATIEFVLEEFVPFRMFSNRGYEACSCVIARTSSGFKVGTCLKLAAQFDSAAHLKAQNLQSIGFGRSWSVTGLNLLQESDAKLLPRLLTAIQPNQIRKVAIGSRSAGILTAIAQAAARGQFTELQEIDFHFENHFSGVDLGTLTHCGLAFYKLNLNKSQIVDITGLGDCKHLRDLYLANTRVADVSVLGSCSSLRTLDLSRTQVTDVSALGSCSSLYALDLSNTQVVDVSALGSCSSLHTLDLRNTQVADVSALGSCSSLRELNLDSTQVADVSALGSCSSLSVLNLNSTQVADVSALGSWTKLCMLSLNLTQVNDVSALGSCSSLHYLDLMGTQVTDVSALNSCISLCTLVLNSWNSAHVVDISAINEDDVNILRM